MQEKPAPREQDGKLLSCMIYPWDCGWITQAADARLLHVSRVILTTATRQATCLSLDSAGENNARKQVESNTYTPKEKKTETNKKSPAISQVIICLKHSQGNRVINTGKTSRTLPGSDHASLNFNKEDLEELVFSSEWDTAKSHFFGFTRRQGVAPEDFPGQCKLCSAPTKTFKIMWTMNISKKVRWCVCTCLPSQTGAAWHELDLSGSPGYAGLWLQCCKELVRMSEVRLLFVTTSCPRKNGKAT